MRKPGIKAKRRVEELEYSEENIELREKSHQVPIKIVKNFKPISNSKLPGLRNFWSIQEPVCQSKATSDYEDDVNPKKIQRLTGSERYQNYINEEERLRSLEAELESQDFEPHTPDQFEKELLKDKNSSFMWIKYMAFHLETAEIDKARRVAKRAIASINYREEKELINVWIALLNLEIRYGSDETYQDVLTEATQRNDPFKIYSQTLYILLDIEKCIEANRIIEILKKRFKPKPDMWLLVAEAYLKMQNEKLAKELLPKSLLSLAEKDHLDYMTKFALLMSRHNVHDFSQTIFEKILSTYSKNLSIWFTYVDMMTKNGQIEIARSLFDRMLVLKFPLKKLKSIFNKYIDFESKHGEPANVSKIKKIALSMTSTHDDE